jgi:hypothetical protein
MLMRQTRAKPRRLRTLPTNRTGGDAWSQLSYRANVRLFGWQYNKKMPGFAQLTETASALILPKKMLQTQAIETFRCLTASATSGDR